MDGTLLVNAYSAQFPEWTEVFIRALNEGGVVMGKTCLFPPLGEVIIPLLKALYNDEGELMGVIGLGLDIESSTDLFSGHLHMGNDDVVYLLRELDRYVQYRSSDIELESPYYREPIPEEMAAIAAGRLEEKYSMTLEEIKAKGGIYSLRTTDRWGRAVISTMTYIEPYGLWIVSDFHMTSFFRRFRPILIMDFSFFIIFLAITFLLIWTIDQSERKKQDALLKQANYDFLTGLPNRNHLKDVLDRWVAPSGSPFALFLIDVDQFKHVNTSFGQESGDGLLCEMAKAIRSTVSRNSLVLRLGEDEFYVMMPLDGNPGDASLLESEASRLKASLSRTYFMNGFQFFVSVCVGAASFPDHGKNWNDLSRAVEIAMGKAKTFRNEVRVFNREMEKAYLAEITIKNHLSDGLKRGEIRTVYQPQVDREGKVAGLEVLARWESPVLGTVPPDRFIKAAEASGLIGTLGDYLLIRTFEDLRDLKAEVEQDLSVSVNISVKQFMRADFLEMLLSLIGKYGIERRRITLEITENLFIEDLEYFIPLMERIRQKGINISMDDFGTGYSSLSVIGNLPIDELKIDKSFIDRISADRRNLQMVKNIISIGNNLGCRVVAEGVETEDQMVQLVEMGCDLIQGYYYSRPLSIGELKEYLTVQRKKGNQP